MSTVKWPIMKWATFIVLIVIFIYSPFKRGLFFSQDMYIYTILLTLSFLICFAIASFKKIGTFSLNYLGLFLLPFMYYVTHFVAESPNRNFEGLFNWLAFIAFFLLLLWVRGEERIERALPYLFSLTGTVIAFFAILGVWKWVSYQDVVLGDRITGPFQYANTFAAVIGAFWIYSLINLVRWKLPWYAIVLFGTPLVAYGVGFLHAYSRGTILMFPLVWLIGLFLLRTREQVLYVAYSIISIVGSLLVFRVMTGQEQDAVIATPGLWAFIFAMIVVVGLCVAVNKVSHLNIMKKLWNALLNRRFLRFAIPGIVIFVGALLMLDILNEGLVYKQMPESLRERVSSITIENASAAARTNMYADAWEMSKDAPILGLGGEGWKVLYSSYQSIPYLSNEIHNGYLEILLNTGWIGLILFLLAFTWLFWQIIHRVWGERKGDDQPLLIASLAALILLFGHAVIDFDFSYGTVWFIIMWLFAMVVPFQPQSLGVGKFAITRFMSHKQLATIARTTKILIVLGIFIGGVYAYRFYAAGNEVSKTQKVSSLTIAEGIRIFEKATSYNPYNVDYWLGLAQVEWARYSYSQLETDKERVTNSLSRAEKLEPNYSATLYKIANFYAGMNDWEKAVSYIEKAIDKDQFNVNWYNMTLSYKMQWAEMESNNGNGAKADELLSSLIEDYEKYGEWYREWRDRLVTDRRPLELDTQAYYIAAESYRLLGQNIKSLKVWESQGATIDKRLYDGSGENLLDKPYEVQTVQQILMKHPNDILIMSVMDEATTSLSLDSKTVLGRIGSSISNLKYRGSYAAVIKNNEVVFDQVNNEGSIKLTNENAQSLVEIFAGRSFAIESAGMNHGNWSSIQMDGVEYSTRGRGINIAVFNQELTHIASYHLDTYISDIHIALME